MTLVLGDVAFWWSLSRAAGIVALAIACLAVTVGILRSGGNRPLLRSADAERSLHEALTKAALVAIAVHALSYAVDPHLDGGLPATLIPFAAPEHRFGVGLGVLAGYGLVAAAILVLVRRASMRWAHGAVLGFWALAVAHALVAGTDAGRPWLLVVILPPIAAVLAAIALREEPTPAAPPAPRAESPAPEEPPRGVARPVPERLWSKPEPPGMLFSRD